MEKEGLASVLWAVLWMFIIFPVVSASSEIFGLIVLIISLLYIESVSLRDKYLNKLLRIDPDYIRNRRGFVVK